MNVSNERQPDAAVASIDPARIQMTADGHGRLLGGRCRECGTVTWGVKYRCPKCWKTDCQDEISLSSIGALYSMVEIHRAPSGYRTPYWIGYVDLPEHVRVFARMRWPSGQPWKLGEPVQLSMESVTFEDGRAAILMPTFSPVEEHNHA